MNRRRRIVLKSILAVFVIAALVVLVRTLPVAEWLMRFQAYVRGAGALGYIVYALVYALCVVFFIPASILTLGAGLTFGVAGGIIVVICGATLGATLSFLLARTVLRHRIEKLTEKNAKFRALDRAITREGTKIVLLVRLAVVFPFTYINYAFGLTGVRLGVYILTTLVGILPGTIAFVYIGALARVAATEANRARLIVYVVGGMIALAVSIFVGRLATNAIKRAGVDDAA